MKIHFVVSGKDPSTRQHFLEQLEGAGFGATELQNPRELVAGPDTDLFDVLAYVLYEMTPITRSSRAFPVVTRGLEDKDEAMRRFLVRVLDAYVKNGEDELAEDRLSTSILAVYGSTTDAQRDLGDIPTIRGAYLEMQEQLYDV